MNIVFFILFVSSKEGFYSFKLSRTITFLSSYGFRENSNFSYIISSSKPVKLNIFLFSHEEFHSSARRYVYRSCNYTNFKITQLNQTTIIPKTNFIWEGHIEEQNIFYPSILLCSPNNTRLTIRYNYSNSISLIDFRNENNSFIYLILSVFNLFLAFLWIINTFIKSNFSIPLQQLLAFVPIVKALSNSFNSYEWEKSKYKSELCLPEKVISFIFTTFSHILFMSSLSLCFSGWCVFRNDVKLSEIANCFLSSSLIVFVLNFEEIFNDSFFTEFLRIFGIFWYIKINLEYFYAAVMLTGFNYERDNMNNRIKLVQNFSSIAFIVIVFFLLVKYCAYYVGMMPIVVETIGDTCILILESVEFYFFFLRESYNGNTTVSLTQSPFYIVDPQRRHFVFFHHDDQ